MNLLIVDDEALIHQAIDYTLAAIGEPDLKTYHAYNGHQMMEQMSARPIDAALVDIQMPGISGLEAIEQAKQHWPDTIYYILSAFSEFDFARKAVHLGVSEYLIKPLSEADLRKVIAAVKQRRGESRSRLSDAFATWLIGGLHHHDVDHLFRPGYQIRLALITDDRPAAQDHPWQPRPDECAEGIFLPCKEGTLVLAYADAPGPLYDRFFTHCALPRGVTVFRSAIYQDSPAAVAAMHQLLHAAGRRVLAGTGICYDQPLLPELPPEPKAAADDLVALRDAWFAGQYYDYSSAALRLRPELRRLDPASMTAAANFLALVLDRPVTPGEKTILQAVADGEQDLAGRDGGQDRIPALIDYINHHYSEDLSIAQLADIFSLSPNYLSSLFKKEKQMKFIDYLTDLRIERAKSLLRSTNLTVKEISRQVGYHSQSHFNAVFCEKVGCTPVEFKRSESGS